MTEKSINIILVEDQALFRKGIISLFDEFDFINIIAEASNGIELIDLLKNCTPHIILLDIEMPLMDGGQTLDFLSKNYPHLPVIMLSQYPSDELIENFLLRGARAYLNKNTVIEIIIETIQRVKNSSSDVKFNKSHLGIFTAREEEIIPLLCKGRTTKQIASYLNVAVKTIEAHRNRLFIKTKSGSIQDFLQHAISHGWQFIKRK